MTQAETGIRVTRPVDGVDLVTLHRPEVRNALDNALLQAIADHLDAAVNAGVRVVVITGGPQVFAAGADLKEMAALDAMGLLADVRPGLWQRIANCPIPVIAAVNGFALGAGCELALHADIVIAGETARFGQPEINLGIMPGAGGTQRLIRAVGKSTAMKMVLAGEFLSARQALAAGLVAEVTPAELSIERAVALAGVIADKSPLAVRQAKEVLLQAFDTHLSEGLRLERKAFCLLGASEDRNEGIQAFLEKRKPQFKGR